jgi:hypothetical protein
MVAVGSLERMRRRRASRRSMRVNCRTKSFRSVRLYRAFGVRCSSSPYRGPRERRKQHIIYSLTGSVENESVVPNLRIVSG